MAALGPARRLLLYGIVAGALTCAANPAGAGVVLPPARAVSAGALSYVANRGGSEAAPKQAQLGRFCRWHPKHRLCSKANVMREFCDRRPDHRLCDDDYEDRFCKKRPQHPLCDDDRFCKKRPDHPLCDDDGSPSPS